MEENYDLVVEIEEIKEEEEAPVVLSNNGFSESVEGVLESYGLPKKGEVDPTFIMSFFYVFFFVAIDGRTVIIGNSVFWRVTANRSVGDSHC